MSENMFTTEMKKDIETIRTEFRRSAEARYIHRLHGVLLVLLGLSTTKAGKLLGDPQRTVAHWVIQFREHGLNGLRDAPKPGRPGILSPAQKKALSNMVMQSPKSAGLKADAWTNAILASTLKNRYGVTLSMRQCSRLLRTLKNQTKA